MKDNNVNSNQMTNTEAVSPESTSNTNTSTHFFNWIKNFEGFFGVSFVVLLGIIGKLIIYYYTMGKFDYWGISRANLVVFGDVIDGFLFGGLTLVIIFTNFFILIEWEITNDKGLECAWKTLFNLIELFNLTVLTMLLFIIPPIQEQRRIALFILVILLIIYAVCSVVCLLKSSNDWIQVGVTIIILVLFSIMIFCTKNERENYFGFRGNEFGRNLVTLLECIFSRIYSVKLISGVKTLFDIIFPPIQRTTNSSIFFVISFMYVMYVIFSLLSACKVFNNKCRYHNFIEKFKINFGKARCLLNGLVFVLLVLFAIAPRIIREEGSSFEMRHLFESYHAIFFSVAFLFALPFFCLKWAHSLSEIIRSVLKKIGVVDTKINEIRKSYRFFVMIISLLLLLTYYGNLVYQEMRMDFSFIEHENFIVLHETKEQLYGANYLRYKDNDSYKDRLIVDTLRITVKDKSGEKILHLDKTDRERIIRKNDLKTLVKEVGENKGETKTIFLNDKNWIMVYEDKEYYYANSYVEQENKIIINIDDRMCFKKDTPELKPLSLEGKQVEFTNKNIEG